MLVSIGRNSPRMFVGRGGLHVETVVLRESARQKNVDDRFAVGDGGVPAAAARNGAMWFMPRPKRPIDPACRSARRSRAGCCGAGIASFSGAGRTRAGEIDAVSRRVESKTAYAIGARFSMAAVHRQRQFAKDA